MKTIKKFPSIENLIQGAFLSFRRFPLVLLCAILTALTLVVIINRENPGQSFLLERLALAFGLGVPLFIALTTWAEEKGFGTRPMVFVQAFGVLLLIVYYITLPYDPFENLTCFIRFLLLMVTIHFAVAFLPYLGANQVNGFWQYNKSLFLKFLNSAVFSAAMFIGLLLALIAARELFGFTVPEKRFAQLFVIMAIGFNTWVFLSGFPKNLRELNEAADYPNFLRIFSQYILLPLIGLYFVILYAYELKIIITWNWPKGWVSQLVLWFSVVGILSLLLLWPLRNLTENRWIKTFTKWFFRALIPLLVMLYLAIFERVGAYGITVNRYLVLAMAIGLTILVLYFVFARTRDIRVIPVVVCLISLFSAYGPWSAFAVSEHSQSSRLEKYLIKNEMLVNGSIRQISGNIPYDDRMKMSGIISYLARWHGIHSFYPWLSRARLDSLNVFKNKYNLPDSIANAMGFAYEPESSHEPGKGKYFNCSKTDTLAISTSGYDYLIRYNSGSEKGISERKKFHIGDDTLFVWQENHGPNLKLSISPGRGFGEFPLADSIRGVIASISHGQISSEKLKYKMTMENYLADIDIRYISGQLFSDSINIYSINSYILLYKINDPGTTLSK